MYFEFAIKAFRKFIRSIATNKDITTKGLGIKLIYVQGNSSDVVCASRFLWVAFANGSPIFQVNIECEIVEGDVFVLPFSVGPMHVNHVNSSLQSANDFPNVDYGMVDVDKHSCWFGKLLTDARYPLDQTTWTASVCKYLLECLEDPNLPLGRLKVLEINGAEIVSKPRTPKETKVLVASSGNKLATLVASPLYSGNSCCTSAARRCHLVADGIGGHGSRASRARRLR